MRAARFESAVPVLPVADVSAAVAFYVSRAAFRDLHAEDGYAVVSRDAVEIHLWRASDETWTHREGPPVVSGAESFLAGTASCRVAVSGIETLFAEMKAAGIVHPNGPLTDKPYGLREFAVLDLDGNHVTFFAPVVA
ncbi:MAG: bleomycin resistance protein [Shimia sp.]